MRRVDRSRVLRYQQCPRARYLEYEHGGIGLRSSQLSIPLATGTQIHAGLAALLTGAHVDAAVALAVNAYQEEADKALSAMNTHVDHYDHTIKEQSCLVEALLRAYALRGLPSLLAEYEVLETEQEYEVDFWGDGQGIFMARLDGLLRKRSDGDLYVLSFKTDTGGNLGDKLGDARIDLQGLTEPWALEQCAARWGTPGNTEHPPLWWLDAYDKITLPPLRVAGVKMEWLVKGSWKEEVKGSGLRYQDSYLIRPWHRQGPVTGQEFAWQYYKPCPGTPHSIVGSSGRAWKCPGDAATHGLGPSWQRVNIWDIMPVKEWIQILAEDPADPLAQALYLPPPVFRNDHDTAHRIKQIQGQERRVAIGAGVIASDVHEIGAESALDYYFPQHGPATGACRHTFGSTCPFNTICWAANPAAALADAEHLGFVPRTPHHAGEMVVIK